jgi:hypothetical protein
VEEAAAVPAVARATPAAGPAAVAPVVASSIHLND